MPSFAATIAATAFATLGLAAPTARQLSPAPFNLNVTSVYTDGKYNNGQLSACHTAAGQESLCILDSGNNPQVFSLDSQTDANGPANIVYNLLVNGGSSTDQQSLAFVQNTTYPALSYGFLGREGTTYEFVVDDKGVFSYQSGDTSISTFYICPEYVDYNQEGYPTLSIIGDYQSVPSDSGCDTVSLTRSYPSSN